MDADIARKIEAHQKSREIFREKLTRLFREVGDHYARRGVAELDLRQGHDVHAFYRLSEDPSRVIHVQGYPGLSDEGGTLVWARLMGYTKLIEIRGSERVSVGNEHGATVQEFPNFGAGIGIPYDSKVLEEKLAENVPQLK